ncbi:leucine-rich repeat domain-containing protein [Parahaliea mediterranea]|uniref:leucine-rich repeat domain-containing protein n=1 Tax=Parahaliea mediterranea TaxID=651086 RepID=UPI001300485B|nr:hypothetical protein [Parahaliea mediterranea]
MRIQNAITSLLFLVLTGCKISIDVPVGGYVQTEAGNFRCEPSEHCKVTVNSTSFDEDFLAVPNEGYYFKGWQKRERGLCGGKRGSCRLTTSGFGSNPALMSLLDADDEVFFLTPLFARAPANWTQIDRALQGVDDDELRACLNFASQGITYAEQLTELVCAEDPSVVQEPPSLPYNWRISSFAGLDKFSSLRTLQAELWCKSSMQDCGIDFSALEMLTGLRTLKLYGDLGHTFNNEDAAIPVEFIRHLKQLTVLELPYVRIDSARPIAELSRLKRLNLNRSVWNDVEYLSALVQLRELVLTDSNVDDPAFFDGMNQLRVLDLSRNWSSISADEMLRHLANSPAMSKLERLRYITSGIADIGPLAQMPSLKSLVLYGNKIQDISALAALTNLQELRLSDNPVTELVTLEDLLRLKTLSLTIDTDKRSQVDALRGLKQLEDLTLSFAYPSALFGEDSYPEERCVLPDGYVVSPCNIEAFSTYDESYADFTFLAEMSRLQKLYIWRGAISDVSFLRHLDQLQEVRLPQNNVRNISSLRDADALTLLDLSWNGSRDANNNSNSHLDLSPLNGLGNLQHLILPGNGIKSMAPLRGISSLRTIDLSDNLIDDLLPQGAGVLDTLPLIYDINLYGNRVESMSGAFDRVTRSLKVNLRGNPITCDNQQLFTDRGASFWDSADPYYVFETEAGAELFIAWDVQPCNR